MDYDPPAEKIAEKGFELATSMGAETTLLHVVAEAFYYSSQNYSPIMGFEGFNDVGMLQQANVDELRNAAQEYLNSTKRHLGDTNIQTLIKEGDFGEAILSAATEVNADIIVMGSHTRHGLDKMLLGSVAENVLHKTTIPLFIIPVKKMEEK